MNKIVKFTTKWQASLIIYFFSILIFISFGWWGSDLYKDYLNKVPTQDWPTLRVKPKPLEKYTIENLSKTDFKPSKININDNIFDFQVDNKRVTGLVNIPKAEGSHPMAILLRGYVDQSIYQTGMGTKRVGEYLANNGYITLAPDFLGYGGSNKEAENIFEARFQTYTTVLTLLKSIESPVNADALAEAGWDGKNIFIWGHSNGGQIALTILAVLGISNPDLIGATVLWAPVTESFPYTVLYYTNESDDEGKFIRQELAKFEEDYDASKFSFTNYLDKINTPIEYHLGTNDDSIPLEWRDKFIKKMKILEKDITNYNHPNADHNMNPLWSEVMQQTLQFFAKQKN